MADPPVKPATDASPEAKKAPAAAAAEADGAKAKLHSEASDATKPPAAATDKPAETASAAGTPDKPPTSTSEKPEDKAKKPGEKEGDHHDDGDHPVSLYERTIGKFDTLPEIQALLGFGKHPTATDKAKLPAVNLEDPTHPKAALGTTAADAADATAKPKDGATTDHKDISFTDQLLSAASWSMKALACASPVGFITAGVGECIDLFESGFDATFGSKVFGKSDGSGRQEDALGKTNNNWKFDHEHAEAVKEISQGLNLDNVATNTIEMPKDAQEIGKVAVAGQEVSVWRGSDGQTVLKDKAGKIIGKDKGDGKYELMLSDEQKSKLDFQISQGADGKFKLDHLDRIGSDGKPLQKIENGVIYNYNYENGKQSIDAVFDSTGRLSPEQLKAKTEEMSKVMGENGQAMIRYLDSNGQPAKFHLQRLGPDTQIETTFLPTPNGRQLGIATIRHHGQEYQVAPGPDGKDQFQIKNPDGSWAELTAAQRAALAGDLETLRQHASDAKKRADGDETVRPGGIRFIRRMGLHGPETVSERVGDDNKPISSITTPDDNSKPIELKNETRHEITTVQGEKVETHTEDGKKVWDFSPDTGLSTPEFTVNERGLTHIPTGLNVDRQGNVFDGAGHKIADGGYNGEGSAKMRAEIEVKTALANSAAIKAISLGSLALSCVSNPAVMQQLALAGLAVIDGAMGQVGGMSVILSLAKCTPLAALSRAGSETQALSTMEKSGVFDSTSQQMAMMASTGGTYINGTSAARHIIEQRRPDLKVA